MTDQDSAAPGGSLTRKAGWTAGIMTVGLLAGGLGALTLPASAAGDTASSDYSVASVAQTAETTPQTDAPAAGRPAEAALSADVAAKVKAAALAEVPGATVDRVEANADGESPYEAHLTEADGTRVTVFVADDLSVVSVVEGGPGGEDCPGGGGPGGRGGRGSGGPGDGGAGAPTAPDSSTTPDTTTTPNAEGVSNV